jgi:inorganic pyrophosphatase
MKLTRVAPFPREGILRVVIETPKGKRNKLDFDPDLNAFVLAKTLPYGMVFPYDFGFIPRTRGEDGDPLDVLVLMSESTAPGCIVDCRLIGVIEATQKEKGAKAIRNDRYIAATENGSEFEHVHKPADLPAKMLPQLQEFFTNYNRLEGKIFRCLNVAGPKAAWSAVRSAKAKR